MPLCARVCLGLALVFTTSAFGETPPSPPPEGSTGITGQILISPIKGGPIREGESSTAPLPGRQFVVRRDGKNVATFTTDEKGEFRVALPPGHYEAVAQEKPGLGFWGPFPFTVNAGAMTRVRWECDSGMR